MYEAEQTKAEQRGAKRGRKPVKPLSPSSSEVKLCSYALCLCMDTEWLVLRRDRYSDK